MLSKDMFYYSVTYLTKSDITSYHAWNEVYLKGKWEIIDTTYDSAYAEKTVAINMIKNASDYRVEKIY